MSISKNTLDAPEACFALAVHETGGFPVTSVITQTTYLGFRTQKNLILNLSKGDGH